jgi:LysM repeat protein
MCGYDLRKQPQRGRRISWVDVVLVLAVLAVLVFWWRVGTESAAENTTDDAVQAILPTSVPLLDPTATPEPTPTAPPTATPSQFVTTPVEVKHTVQSGDTLLSIALDYGVTVEEIQQANNLTGVLIRVGDELIIPGQLADAVSALAGPASDFSYIVVEGDTLVSIALRFGSSVQDIQTANSLGADALIRPGDRLTIPVRGAPPEALQPTPAAPAPAAEGATAPIYNQPQLISPSQGATIVRTEPVLLQWASVGVLQPNEWYVLQVLPRGPQSRVFPTVWTKQTSHRIGVELAPDAGQLAEYDWLVSIVQVTSVADGRPSLAAASPPSEVRRFVWQ